MMGTCRLLESQGGKAPIRGEEEAHVKLRSLKMRNFERSVLGGGGSGGGGGGYQFAVHFDRNYLQKLKVPGEVSS